METSTIEYKGIKYITKEIELEDGEVVKIAEECLGDLVYPAGKWGGNYKTSKDRYIDESIFFYVPTGMLENITEQDLKDYLLEHAY